MQATWREYAEMVRSWKHVDERDKEHAAFVAEARELTGGNAYAANVAYALVQHNAAHAHAPSRHARGRAATRSTGRYTRPSQRGMAMRALKRERRRYSEHSWFRWEV